MANRVLGYKGKLYLATADAGAASPLANLTDMTISLDEPEIDQTCLEDAQETAAFGRPKYSIPINGIFHNSDLALWKARRVRTGAGLAFYAYPDSDTMGLYVYGRCWVSANLKHDNKGNVTCSGKLVPAAGSNWVENLGA